MDEQEFDFENRILSTFYTAQDQEIDTDLRPKKLTDYIGQDKVKENLKVYIDAAKLRGDTLDHVLLYGPPGLGKTTLSGIIANELGVKVCVEGIEDRELADFLKPYGPGSYQGYYFSRPISIEKLKEKYMK